MEKIPNFENPESRRFRTIDRKVLEVLPTGESIEEVIECNESHHRKCIDKITYGADNEIIFVDQLSREELGPCGHNHS
jgi:hypothetical protein